MYTYTHIYTYVFFADVHSMLNLKKKVIKWHIVGSISIKINQPAPICVHMFVSAFSKEKGGEGHKGWLRVGVGWCGEMISFAFMYHVLCPFTC